MVKSLSCAIFDIVRCECYYLSNVEKHIQTKIRMKKYIKSRKRFKLIILFTSTFLLFFVIVVVKHDNHQLNSIDPFMEILDHTYNVKPNQGVVIPEKYNEHDVKTRLIKNKIKLLTHNKDDNGEGKISMGPAKTITQHIHIFYSLPVTWYKRPKNTAKRTERVVEPNGTKVSTTAPLTQSALNIAFYPSLGLYKPTTSILRKHFDSIKDTGIGVLIITVGPKLTEKLLDLAFDLVSDYNLTITVEITAQHNKSLDILTEQMRWLDKYIHHSSFYKVYSVSKKRNLPLIYVRNAYKIEPENRILCPSRSHGGRQSGILDAIFIGHVRLKQHTDFVRRSCFDGFYTRHASNGATFSSTWKNWSYLKSFAETYKMIFIPTVSPGYAERNKLPRHGNMQRLRSNGRYYGVAWRTAITNHVGFINVATYNNWQEGTQIEEAIAGNGFMDYLPGAPTKYIDLTTHWVDNFLRTKKVSRFCNELLNNTIC